MFEKENRYGLPHLIIAHRFLFILLPAKYFETRASGAIDRTSGFLQSSAGVLSVFY